MVMFNLLLAAIPAHVSPGWTIWVVEQSSPVNPRQMVSPGVRLEQPLLMMAGLITASWYLQLAQKKKS